MANIRNNVYERSQLWSNANGRDYIKVGDEIYSINGLYCDRDGKPDRYGRFVVVMDIRWTVVERSSWDSVLRYRGDSRDVQALEHYGFKRDGETLIPPTSR